MWQHHSHCFRACLREGGGPQVGVVTCGGLPHLTCKRDQIKIRYYMDRRVTPPKRVTSPTWKSFIKLTPGLNQSVCTWYYFVVSAINLTANEVTFRNVYHTEVRDGGHAAIGPQSALHVGQSAVNSGLVYDLILSHCDVMFISIYLFLFVKFSGCGRNVHACL